jgi:hypothetical protein
MTREEAIKLAEQAGWKGPKDNVTFVAILQAYANLVAAAERRACIRLLEDFSQTTMVPVKDTWRMGLIAGANALRARELGDLTKEAEQNGEEL